MQMRAEWLLVAAALLAASSAVALGTPEREYDHSKKMREEHRRNLPQ